MVWGVCVGLGVLTFAVFGQTLGFDFVNYDDSMYVYDNPLVARGLTGEGIAQAFTHGSGTHWDPLTVLTRMLDCQIYGLHAGGHHFTNVLLHTTSAILLFLLLRRMTGALWRSAFVAAVFAIHPLRVESVAWVTERKDVLSGLFFMLTIAAYLRYARQPTRLGNYLMVVLCFALGLMSKAMLVSLPWVLLLLDWWPLKRFAWNEFAAMKRPLLEKIPLLALSVAAGVATFFLQGESVQSAEVVPFALRLGNAPVSCVNYLLQMIWPAKLAVFYPYPINGLPGWEVVGALLVLIGISWSVFAWRRERPYLLVGWLWYLGMILPVIGLVQSGGQAHADRFTYLPQIGLYIALVWLTASVVVKWRAQATAVGAGAILVILALAVTAFAQTAHWRNSETLWKHTLACTTNNTVAENNLGEALEQNGRPDEAMGWFQKALDAQPTYAEAQGNLGNLLLQKGKLDDALAHLKQAAQLNPSDAKFHSNLGNGLRQAGRLPDAVAELQMAVAMRPDNADFHYNLALALFQEGQVAEAGEQFAKTLELLPSHALARENLVGVAWLLATSPADSVRNGSKAVEFAQAATQGIGRSDPATLCALAAAYAETMKFTEAAATASEALRLAQQNSDTHLIGPLQEQIRLYQAGQPYRDAGAKPAASH